MPASDPLRDTVARLARQLDRALGGGRALPEIRSTATLALELAGGRPDRGRDDLPPAWALDTLTETELALAFVLGCVERAIRRPERTPHLLRDARERIAALARDLERSASR